MTAVPPSALTFKVEPGRSLPAVGAIVVPDGVLYRVWAPDHEVVHVVTPRFDLPMTRDDDGCFVALDPDGRAGERYFFKLGKDRVPDPASRFQPQGVEGPSEVVDPRAFRWRAAWTRPPLRGRVIYELHIGTFSAAGTFRGAIEHLDHLVDLGVNTIEIMPVADFTGRWNWGYDGVMLFAPARCYGTPDDFRALIDAAHERGLAVILDVVYNHLGPCGNVLPRYSGSYLHPTRSSFWGQALNFDGPGSGPVRAFFLQNAAMWFDEYRVDGLRLDAVHAITDESERHIIAEIAALAAARGGFVIAEDERNDAAIITDAAAGGWGVDGMWADDFHHSVRVALTGQRDAYFANYTGRAAEWAEILREGWLYRGQHYPGWDRPRGRPAGHLPPERFVYCISNHDQVGNRPLGDRLDAVVSAAAYRAASMLLCFAPYTPMLFMGQEWAASSPFPYFTDHPGEVGENMARNRIREFEHAKAGYSEATLARMPDPQRETTFTSAKLRWEERDGPRHAPVLALYRDCLRLRARERVFQSADRATWRVKALAGLAMALRWTQPGGDWLLVVSLAGGCPDPAGDAFTRAAPGRRWRRELSSNDPRYRAAQGGAGGAEDPNAPVAVLLREEPA